MNNELQTLYNQKAYRTSSSNIKDIVSKDELARFNWFASHTALDLNKSSILEIGPGSGSFYYCFLKKFKPNYKAFEINENTIEQFERFFPGKRHLIIKTDALNGLKKSAEKYDCIVAQNILEHFDDDYLGEVFELMVQKLEKGGELWINVPCGESIIFSENRYFDLTHKRVFVLANFRSLAEMFNLSLVAKAGKIIAVENLKDAIRWLHEKFLYCLNRLLFAFSTGTREKLGVFSAEMSVILKK